MAKRDKGTSKVDMVRDAIGKLGWGAGTEEYQKYIKDTYGADMSKPHISQTKSNERKRQGVRGRGRRRRGRPAGTGEPTVAATAQLTDILSFVTEVQQWEQKLGAKTIRKVVDRVLKK